MLKTKKQKISTYFSKRFYLLIILLILLVIPLIFLSHKPIPQSIQDQSPSTLSEINELSTRKLNFGELKDYFVQLAETKGAVYAYRVLLEAPMPPNTDMHLMGHYVGEVLYKQQGAQGIKYCTKDFRNACSHTIVVGLLLEKGDSALEEIISACKQAPGGEGAYTMCFHGLGHGILAFTNYDLTKAVALCKKVGSQKHNFQEYGECVGGAIMEQISGGDHDRKSWEQGHQINLKSDNPLYPCNSDVISDPQAKTYCYIYLTPHLFNLGGANFAGRPTESAIQKAFTFCESIPESDHQYQNLCFGGFGKEFVGLAKDRDIRRIETMNDRELTQVYSWCLLTDNKIGQTNCIDHAVGSMFWGGENDSQLSIRFCNSISDPTNSDACFKSLIKNINTYYKDPEHQKETCLKLPEKNQQECLKKPL